LLAQVGVTEGVLIVRIICAPTVFANYLEGGPASSGLAALYFFLNRQDAQLALPVGTDRTMAQSPAALETNDADDTRICCHEVSPLRQPSTANP
jgi:hypothetical protein